MPLLRARLRYGGEQELKLSVYRQQFSELTRSRIGCDRRTYQVARRDLEPVCLHDRRTRSPTEQRPREWQSVALALALVLPT